MELFVNADAFMLTKGAQLGRGAGRRPSLTFFENQKSALILEKRV